MIYLFFAGMKERPIGNPKSIFSPEQWRSSIDTPRRELLIRPGIEIKAALILQAGNQRVQLTHEEKQAILVTNMRKADAQKPMTDEKRIEIHELSRMEDDGGVAVLAYVDRYKK